MPLAGEPVYGRGDAFPGNGKVVNYKLPEGTTLPGIFTGSTLAVATVDGDGPPLACDGRMGFIPGDQAGFRGILFGDSLPQDRVPLDDVRTDGITPFRSVVICPCCHGLARSVFFLLFLLKES